MQGEGEYLIQGAHFARLDQAPAGCGDRLCLCCCSLTRQLVASQRDAESSQKFTLADRPMYGDVGTSRTGQCGEIDVRCQVRLSRCIEHSP